MTTTLEGSRACVRPWEWVYCMVEKGARFELGKLVPTRDLVSPSCMSRCFPKKCPPKRAGKTGIGPTLPVIWLIKNRLTAPMSTSQDHCHQQRRALIRGRNYAFGTTK